MTGDFEMFIEFITAISHGIVFYMNTFANAVFEAGQGVGAEEAWDPELALIGARVGVPIAVILLLITIVYNIVTYGAISTDGN